MILDKLEISTKFLNFQIKNSDSCYLLYIVFFQCTFFYNCKLNNNTYMSNFLDLTCLNIYGSNYFKSYQTIDVN